MTEVREPIQKLIATIEEGHSNEAIVSAALLLERRAMNREGDVSYAYQLTDELYRHLINQQEFDALVAVLRKRLPQETVNTESIIWALGKTYSADVIPDLFAAFQQWVNPSVNLLHQLVISAEDCSYAKRAPELVEFLQKIVTRLEQLERQRASDPEGEAAGKYCLLDPDAAAAGAVWLKCLSLVEQDKLQEAQLCAQHLESFRFHLNTLFKDEALLAIAAKAAKNGDTEFAKKLAEQIVGTHYQEEVFAHIKLAQHPTE